MPLPAAAFAPPIALSGQAGRTLLALAVGASLTLAGGGILSAQQRGVRPAGGSPATAGPAGEGGNPLWVSATPLDDGRPEMQDDDMRLLNPWCCGVRHHHGDGLRRRIGRTIRH
jgi:hypothetical protein